MRRVVVTGLGIVSPIGNNADEVLASLKAGTSGIVASPEMAEHGFRSQIAGTVKLDITEHVEKRALRFMGPGAAYAYIAMGQAIADAGLDADTVSNPRTGLIAGSGGPSTSAMFTAHNIVKDTGATKRIGPFAVPKCMSSTISANLSTQYKIKGINYSITSACSTSLHCIGSAAEQIMMGKQDVMFAGGAEELDWTLSCLFDAMGAMSSKYNDTPVTTWWPHRAKAASGPCVWRLGPCPKAARSATSTRMAHRPPWATWARSKRCAVCSAKAPPRLSPRPNP